jgi:lipopolysaccharide export system permease protein
MFYPFLFGIALFTVLFMATGPIFDMVNLVTQYGVPVLLVLKYAIVRLPSFIAYTLPMALLLATIVAFGRLSGDHEILAKKSSGIHFLRIFAPVFVFASIVACISYFFNDYIGPEALYEARVIVQTSLHSGKLPPVQNLRFASTINNGVDQILIARSFDQENGIIYDPVIDDYARNGNLVRITHAERAIWENGSWTLEDGEVFLFDHRGLFESRMGFSRVKLNLKQSPHQIGLMERNPDEMESPSLKKSILALEKDPLQKKSLIRYLWMKYYIREALPFACIVFAFIGAPSGIRPVRSSSQTGVALSVLIILLYYFAMAICKSFGQDGKLPEVLAAWIPNLVFLGIGFLLLIKETG